MVDIFNVLIIMNEAKIKLAKEKNRPYDINLQIRKKLKDRAIFYKIDKEKAYQILLNVGVAEDMLIETYIKLVNREKYDYLVITGKINPNDNYIIIKFYSSSFSLVYPFFVSICSCKRSISLRSVSSMWS